MGTVDETNNHLISTVHPDILQAHILTRIDGPTLASVACVSSELHALSTDEKLWRQVSAATWPSINNETISGVVSAFPGGYRSFFADSHSFFLHRQPSDHIHPTTTERLISAVDIYYKDNVIYSTVINTDTLTKNFLSSTFRLHLLDLKLSVPIQTIQTEDDETWINTLEDNMSLSWILIDPNRKRAMNLSSRKSVTELRSWMTDEVDLVFSTVMEGDRMEASPGVEALVECQVVVRCGRKEGGEVEVSKVGIEMEDMEGKNLNGKDSMVILRGVMERMGKKGKVSYEEYLEKKSEWVAKITKRVRSLNKICNALDIACYVVGATAFLTLCNSLFFV